MIDDRFLPRVWTDKGYYYPIFSELGITYENKNLPFTKENIKDINWAFRWRFNENVDMEYINTLEQCTGLRDKNGKLIFEGDILTDGANTFIVNWYDDMALFRLLYKNDNRETYCLFYPDDAASKYTVIGNIHEEL